MTLALFSSLLREVTVEAAGRAAQTHIDDPIYGYGLFTSDGYGYISDCVFSKHGLSQVVKEYQSKDFYPDHATAYRDLKWSPCDSPYQLENASLYDECCHLLNELWNDARQRSDEYGDLLYRDLNKTFIETLQAVRDLNLFDQACVFSIFAGDQSDEARVVNADRLNSVAVCAAFEGELRVSPSKLARLRKTRWPTDESYEA